ncbi:MAG: SUMF1/EgtB/PvdO family nonheme iron enzyme [Bacteroidota bacterium]
MKINLSKSANSLQSKIFVIAVFVCLILRLGANANNLTVSNSTLTGKNTTSHYVMVQFDVSWENSWRTSTAPSNWDAVWVFVKYRVAGGAWQHATLNTTGYTAPTGSAISVTSDGKGAFVYRNANGTGSNSWTGAQLRWNYGVNGVSDAAVVDILVYGVEMVYVPAGAFSLGSGASTEYGAFYKSPTNTVPYSVTSEAAISVGTTANYLYYGNYSPFCGDRLGPIPAAFPKGYNAFYCMKYEITQQEYVDFLNCLTYTQQSTRTVDAVQTKAPNSAAGTYLYYAYPSRFKIKIATSGTNSSVPAIYATDNPYVAHNYLSWADLAAYLDWSGLRPMTELEFEKACRGPNTPVANEYAWGSTSLTQNTGITNSGLINETSTNGGNCTYGNSPYVGGPMRVGAFATASTSRVQAGATYYGVMEMSGNLNERPVTVGNSQGRAFTGLHGDGVLATNGDANVTYWPAPTSGLGAGFRGGSWKGETLNDNSYGLKVSNRSDAAYDDYFRYKDCGGRGVRLAP